jgi:phospholipid-binding lipoprotein MlaA
MKIRKAATATAAVCLTLLTAGCATGPDRKPEDPFEPANRVIFKFNDKLDRTIAQPVARGYQKVTPQPLREAISSFFSNIGDVGSLANSVLQLKITEATETLMRIVINSTFGVGGMFDVATLAGLSKHPEDFGLTLGRYGVPAGPYLVLPVFGPSSVRDGIGMGVDVKFNLLNYIEPAVRNPMYVTQFVSARSDMLGATDLLQQAALDQYSFVRDAFRQQRESRLRGTTGGAAPLPDYGDPGEGGGTNGTTPGGAGGAGENGGAALPDYTDPGESSGAALGTTGATGATGTTGASAGAEGAGAAAAVGTAGVGAAAAAPAAAASAPRAASAPAAASAPGAAKAPAKSGSGATATPAPAAH